MLIIFIKPAYYNVFSTNHENNRQNQMCDK
jgi:hypothetical protein